MPICPVCKYNYENGETECVDCGVTLVDDLPEESEKDLDGVEYTPFRPYPNRLDAEIVKETLANEGIPAVIKTEQTVAYSEIGGSPSTGVVLWVAEDSEETAERIADQIGRNT